MLSYRIKREGERDERDDHAGGNPGRISVAFVMARQLMRFIRSGEEERKTKIIWLSKGFQDKN